MKQIFISLVFLSLSTTIAYGAGMIPCEGSACRACDLVQMFQGIIEWFIATMASLIAIMFIWGGLKMVMSAGNSGEVSKAKGIMTNSIIGFIILLAGWLIVDTALKYTVKSSVYGVWNKIECVANPAMSSAGTSGGVTGSGGSAAGAGQLTDSAARDLLTAAGISINKTAAQGTSLEGMNTATVQDIIDLKKDCNCTIIVTGGTEGVHAAGVESHANGYKYDIGLNPQVNSYITSTYTNIGTRSDGAVMYKAPDGTIYAKEGNHWDVKVPA
jgi:hypothetical protein